VKKILKKNLILAVSRSSSKTQTSLRQFLNHGRSLNLLVWMVCWESASARSLLYRYNLQICQLADQRGKTKQSELSNLEINTVCQDLSLCPTLRPRWKNSSRAKHCKQTRISILIMPCFPSRLHQSEAENNDSLQSNLEFSTKFRKTCHLVFIAHGPTLRT
jgi:hypothetical protein